MNTGLGVPAAPSSRNPGQPIRLLIVGRPGSGKGTQAKRLAGSLDITHISTGDLLRDAMAGDRAVARECHASMSAGRLVPTPLVRDLVVGALLGTEALERGFVLDGFPRTLPQLDLLTELLGTAKLDAAVELEVSGAVVFERLAARQRTDDDPAAVRRRLAQFEHETRPMIRSLAALGLLISMNGQRDANDIALDLLMVVARLDLRSDPELISHG